MKIYLMLAAASIACASAVETLPTQIQKIVDARSTAVAKVNQAYSRELEALKSDYMKAGDLANANLCDQLIKGSTPVAASAATFNVEGKWKYRLTNKVGSVQRGFLNGKMTDEDGSVRPYQINGNKVRIKFGQAEEILTVDPAKPDVMEGVNSSGTTFTYTRVQ